MNRATSGSLTLALIALAIGATGAPAQTNKAAALAGPFHATRDRGPLRKADLSPFAGPVSSEILAGPQSGLDSAFVIYTRMAAGGTPKGLYTLPVDHTYLVLAGKLDVQLGTDTFVAAPETLVLVPAGTPHRAWNAGSAADAVLEVVTPAPSIDLAAMMKPAAARRIENAAQYIRVAPPLRELVGGTGHESLNERILASLATGSENVLERLNDMLPGGGRTERHMHPFDQVYFVRHGSMKVDYGMSTYTAGADTLVVLPVGVAHNNANSGTEPQSIVTLLLPEPKKGSPMGQSVNFDPPPAARGQ